MSFSFPTNLSSEEITQCLADLQIPLDVGQLTKPTPEAVRICYEQAVIALMGIPREELMQPKFSALCGFEYPELHDESIPASNFFRQLTKLMIICGVKDFNLNDVFKPEPPRLKRNLCALINFAKFRDEKVALLDELEAEQAVKMATEQALVAEAEKNMAELRRLKEQRAARQAEVGPIEAETAAAVAQLAQLNKMQATLQNETRVLKAQINALTDQAADAKLTLASLQNEIDQLQDQIVQSPEKHRIAIAEVVGATEHQRTYYARLRSESNDHDRKLEIIAKFERELQRCVKLQEELEGVIARKKEASAAAKDTREAIATEERIYSELASSSQTARRQMASLQEKLSRVEQQGQLKVDAAAAMVQEQLMRRERAERQQAAEDARSAEQEAQIRTWRERAAELVAQKEARARAVQDRYTTLRRTVTEYHRKLQEEMSAPLPAAVRGFEQPVHGDDGSAGLDVSQGRDTGVGMRGAAGLASGLQGFDRRNGSACL